MRRKSYANKNGANFDDPRRTTEAVNVRFGEANFARLDVKN